MATATPAVKHDLDRGERFSERSGRRRKKGERRDIRGEFPGKLAENARIAQPVDRPPPRPATDHSSVDEHEEDEEENAPLENRLVPSCAPEANEVSEKREVSSGMTREWRTERTVRRGRGLGR
jgi:hypothetical protein